MDNSIYEQSQRLVSATTATYENVLFDNDVASFVGSFTCEVSNVRGRAEETTELNGKYLVASEIVELIMIIGCLQE